MLSSYQRQIIFGLFCVGIFVFGALEIFLFYWLFTHGVEPESAGIGALNTGFLAALALRFKRMIDKHFLAPEPLPIPKVSRWAADRIHISAQAARFGHDQFSHRKELVTNTLRLAEDCLKGWISGTHFEICVFVDREEPLLFAYFDSDNATVSRSMADREQNPKWYVEKGYEVTKLLSNPTSQPKVISDTTKPKEAYFFHSDSQRNQIKSTMLYCLDVERSSALVISSNEAGALKESDHTLVEFIKLIGVLVRHDLFSDDFDKQIRVLKPALFAGGSAPQRGHAAMAIRH
jgi:hypothetical protein